MQILLSNKCVVHIWHGIKQFSCITITVSTFKTNRKQPLNLSTPPSSENWMRQSLFEGQCPFLNLQNLHYTTVMYTFSNILLSSHYQDVPRKDNNREWSTFCGHRTSLLFKNYDTAVHPCCKYSLFQMRQDLVVTVSLKKWAGFVLGWCDHMLIVACMESSDWVNLCVQDRARNREGGCEMVRKETGCAELWVCKR